MALTRRAAARHAGRRRRRPSPPADRATRSADDAAPPAGDGQVVPFHGAHQAGIATPAQDRLQFAAFDVTAGGRARPARADARLDARPRRDDARPAARAVAARTARAAGRHRRGDRSGARAAHDHVRLRARRCSTGASGSPAAGPAALARAPAARRRRARPGAQRRRPLRAGVRGRSAGRVPRGPQPGADRPRRRRDALVAARLRPHVDHEPDAAHAAQPDGLQGRHEQPQRRRRRRARRARLGGRRPRGRAGVDARRHLPRRAPHPDADRGLGPRSARRAGGDDRPPQATRARRSARTTSSTRLRRAGRRRDPAGRATSGSRRRPRTTAPRSCGAATRSPTASTPSSAQLDAGLFFICLPARPATAFVRIQRRLGANDALNEYIKHVGSGVFAIPPGAPPGGYVGQTLLDPHV